MYKNKIIILKRLRKDLEKQYFEINKKSTFKNLYDNELLNVAKQVIKIDSKISQVYQLQNIKNKYNKVIDEINSLSLTPPYCPFPTGGLEYQVTS
jgi:hypothetical protein